MRSLLNKVMETENLNTKNIKDFTPEDTIYIRDKDHWNKILLLCQFVSYNEKTKSVTGVFIECDYNTEHTRGYRVEVGKQITASLKNCALYGSVNDTIKHAHYNWFDHLGYALNPFEAEKQSTNHVHIEEHESYGVIRGSRHSSNSTPLFGTSVTHNQTISISIHTAKHERDLANDWIHPRKEIIEIELSENQFAQFITDMNSHGGTPCTIRHLGGKMMAKTPFIAKQELFQEEFEKKMENLSVDIKRVIHTSTDILKNKASINKADRELILKDMEALVTKVADNIPFVRQQFREQLDDMITEAKVEIEAFAENVIRTKGLEALGASNEEFKNILQAQKDKTEL